MLLLTNPFFSFINLFFDNLKRCSFNFVSNLLSDLLKLLTCLTFTWSQAKEFLIKTFESINFWVKCFREQLNIICEFLRLWLGCFNFFFWGFSNELLIFWILHLLWLFWFALYFFCLFTLLWGFLYFLPSHLIKNIQSAF